MAEKDLCTPAQVEGFLQIKEGSSSNYDLVERVITEITESFQSYCNVKQFKLKAYTEYHDGDGSDLLFVYNKPLVSVTEINICSDWLWAADTTTAPADYRIVSASYIALKSTEFTIGSQNVKIQYSAGYDTIPNDLVRACVNETARIYNHPNDFDVISRSAPDGSVTYTEKGFLTSTKTTLNKYKELGIY